MAGISLGLQLNSKGRAHTHAAHTELELDGGTLKWRRGWALMEEAAGAGVWPRCTWRSFLGAQRYLGSSWLGWGKTPEEPTASFKRRPWGHKWRWQYRA